MPAILVGHVHAASGQAVVGMPFSGRWAYNTLVNPPYTDSNSSHPSVHHTPGGGDWATDVYAAEGTVVKLNVPVVTGALSFSWKPTSTTCGQSTGVNIIVDGTTIGWLYYAHLNNAVTSGQIINGMQLGTVHDWVVNGVHCNPGIHVHQEFKNATNYSCYVDNGQPGITLNYGANEAVIGSGNAGAQQACTSIPSNPNTTSTLRTIPTSDGHIQTFRISNGALSEDWYSFSDGTVGSWTQPVAMPSTPTGTPTVVARSGQNVVDIFVRGSNNQVYTTWYNFQYGAWGGWIGMGGGPMSFTSDPQAVATSDGHDQVFGTGGGLVEQIWYNPSGGTYGGWSTSAGLGASATGSPALVLRSGQNVIDAFARGGNNQIYETWYNFGTGGWGGWINMGGTVTSDPQAVATSDGHDQIFGTGSNLVQENWFSPSGTYGGWVTSAGLAANAVGSPALAPRTGQNVIDAFIRGGDNQVYETWYNFQAGGWGGWINMGGTVSSDAQTQQTSDGHDQVFGTSNNQVQQNWFSPNGTYGGWISF